MLRKQVYTERAHANDVRRRVSRWYSRHGRDLPWRRTHDPYAVLVSEVMLQQTQVSRVLPAYRAFLTRFPSLRALARASLGDVLRVWSGLGYNRRARDLHRSARSSDGALPTTVDALDSLPGIGAYTAGAVACFAHGRRVAFADTNVRRVLGRVFLGRVATEREAVAIDRELLPRDAARWHHALMDIGALFCRARTPRCDDCPLAASCRGRGSRGDATRRRQSVFATSDRRIRGWIITLLSERDAMRPRDIETAIEDDRVPRILAALERDGLIERRAGRVALPS
jgi:A/G-specific adenine glycosylase